MSVVSRFAERVNIVLPILMLVTLMLAPASMAVQPPAPPAAPPAGSPQDDPDWVQKYLADDPLTGQESVTLDDLRQALQVPERRDLVIGRHFSRLRDATDQQKLEFLKEALHHESQAVQRAAARQLQILGELESVILEQLTELLTSGSPQQREASIIALELIQFDTSAMPEEYWQGLVDGLGSADEQVRSSASRQLESQGDAAVPGLLEALKSARPEVYRESARLLSRIVGTRESLEAAMAPAPFEAMEFPDNVRSTFPSWGDSGEPRFEAAAVPPPKAALESSEPHAVREEDQKTPTVVRVFYGTNREIVPRNPPAWGSILFYPALGCTLLLTVILLLKRPSGANQRIGCYTVVMTGLMLAVGVWAMLMFRTELIEKQRLGTGPQFGGRRDPAEQVHYGFCDVSIPPTHVSGEVESPLLGGENENAHVVLKTTELLQEQAFFDAVRSELAKRTPSSRSCFVFIHGFNVSFELAARRTAQIHFDLKFEGAPIFFSWPSRTSIRHYFSDRNEIGFSQYVIRQFLVDVAERVNADRIHVIAHSMGADATCRAIAELGDRGRIFDQIILAAPDIDRDVFRLQLAPRLARTANRTTLYCSRNDRALQISNTFNDGLRAGDSSRGILTTRDVDTVDASGIDTDLLGHSYYGDCLPILNDVQALFQQDQPPENRRLVPWPVADDLRYWTFADTMTTDEPRPSSDSDDAEPAAPQL